MQSEDWRAYQAILQERISALAEGLLVCGDFAEYQKVVGGLRAYEEMATLPDLVIAKMEELRGRTIAADTNARTAADEYRSHRYGSRYWAVDGARNSA